MRCLINWTSTDFETKSRTRSREYKYHVCEVLEMNASIIKKKTLRNEILKTKLYFKMLVEKPIVEA